MNHLEEYLDELRSVYNPYEGWSREDGCDPSFDDDGYEIPQANSTPGYEDEDDIEF
jgi:hypothetical protein